MYLENRILEQKKTLIKSDKEDDEIETIEAGEAERKSRRKKKRSNKQENQGKNRNCPGCNAMQPAARKAVREVKLIRAQGGCLGTRSRRKTRQAAKSHGEGQIPGEPWVSEWGNPHEETSCIRT